MPDIKLKIDGKTVTGKNGSSVLDVCRMNGIYIPTLCHFQGLSDAGACRICIVEIDGERRPVPSCTYAAREGLVVRTSTEQLEKYRRQMLELLFAERNHFCMFCEQSGECELQQLAYRYRMDNNRYQGLFPRLPVDTLSQYLVIDHNRCILCGRCIRACHQIAGNKTLDFGGRGGNTMVTADLDQALGSSSCTLCGACLQVCPTGAIMAKPMMYKGKTNQCTTTAATCPGCSIGCNISVFVKDNNIVRIDSPDLSRPDGPLCRTGRFELLGDNRARVRSPMARVRNGNLQECSLDEAISAAATGLKKAGTACAGLISSGATSETLVRFGDLFKKVLKSDLLDTVDGNEYRVISAGIHDFYNNGAVPKFDTNIADILTADCILATSSNIDQTHPVAGNLIRRAVNEHQAKLIVIDPDKNPLQMWSTLWLQPAAGTETMLLNGLANLIINSSRHTESMNAHILKEFYSFSSIDIAGKTGIPEDLLKNAAEIFNNSRHTIIVAGRTPGQPMDVETVNGLLKIAELTSDGSGSPLRLHFLKRNINSRSAWEQGLAATDIQACKPDSLYLLLSDDTVGEPLLTLADRSNFLVVQASYHSPIMEIADIVLPSPIWSERSGGYTLTDSRTIHLKPVIQNTVPADIDIINRIIKHINNGH